MCTPGDRPTFCCEDRGCCQVYIKSRAQHWWLVFCNRLVVVWSPAQNSFKLLTDKNYRADYETFTIILVPVCASFDPVCAVGSFNCCCCSYFYYEVHDYFQNNLFSFMRNCHPKCTCMWCTVAIATFTPPPVMLCHWQQFMLFPCDCFPVIRHLKTCNEEFLL